MKVVPSVTLAGEPHRGRPGSRAFSWLRCRWENEGRVAEGEVPETRAIRRKRS